jgi:glycosyltransferase involved in cell wall biosynthesis
VNKRIEKDEVNKGRIESKKKYPKMDIKQYSNGMRFDVVIVLGMHRSGTSAITRGLELFGVDLGQNLLAANEYNPKGYFEDNQLVNINDNILRKSGSLWSALQFLEPADLLGSRFEKEQNEARKFLKGKLAQGIPIGLKDPRLSRILPLWQKIFVEMGVRVGYLIAFRNPFEIASSLEKRDGMSVDYGLTLWGSYQTDALRHTEGKSRLFVGFHQLLENSERELTRISEFLETTWNPRAQSALEYEKKFLDAGLRHHKTEKRQALEPVELQALALALDKVCQKSDKKELEDVRNAAKEALLGMMQLSDLIRKNNQNLLQSSNSVELFYSKDLGDFSQERKISKPFDKMSSFKEVINVSLSGEVGLAPYWRLDPGCRPGIIHLLGMKFLDSKGHVVWDLQNHREQVLVQGTAVQLPLPPAGVELVSSGSDPAIILPALPGEAPPVSSILVDIEFNSTQEELSKLVQMQAQKAADFLQALGEKDSQVAQMKSILDKNEMKIAQTIKIDEKIEQIRQEMEQDRMETKLVVNKVEKELAQQRKAQQEPVQKSVVEVKKEIVEEIQSLIANLVEQEEKNRFELSAQIASVKDGAEQRIIEVGEYAAKIREAVVSPSSYLIPAPFSWYSYLYKMLNIREPVWLNKEERSREAPKRPGFWRRLERNIRKKRKRWIATIGFDRDWYLQKYKDVATAGIDPLEHYIHHGIKEKRFKNAKGDNVKDYLLNNKVYEEWISKYDTLSEADKATIVEKSKLLKYKPLFSIVMPVYNTPSNYLTEAIESIRSQCYPNWEICIADDNSPKKTLHKLLNEYKNKDKRIKVTYRKENGHIAAASNSALELARGDYVVLMDHDDTLPPHALYAVALELNNHPETDIVYTDEDKIDQQNIRFNPYFKSDWNRELFYSQNYISHLGVYRTELVRKVGGFRVGFEGSQDYDLALRCLLHTSDDKIRHIPRILYHWRVFPNAETFSTQNADKCIASAKKALTDYFQSIKKDVEIRPITQFHWWRIRYPLRTPAPSVTIIIPTRNGLHYLRQTVNSIISHTKYNNYDIIIVDNDSNEDETLQYLNEIKNNQKVKVLTIRTEFNFALLNNRAAASTNSDYLVFLNNDITVINDDWLSELVSQCSQQDVGAVGAKLYYPNNHVQHAGVILGVYGVAGHSHRHKARNDVGYFGRLKLAQDVSAVTAACLLVKRQVFEKIKGFDEKELKVGYNDVDLCLKIRKAGYRIIFTPFAELYHHESATRGEDNSLDKKKRNFIERNLMLKRWGDQLTNDPFYNPNLSLKNENHELAFPPRNQGTVSDHAGKRFKNIKKFDGIEFVCPFHRGDVLLGTQAALAANNNGLPIRFHVAEELVHWVSDFCPEFDVNAIKVKVPPAQDTQRGIQEAISLVASFESSSPFIVQAHPKESLAKNSKNLFENFLESFGLQDIKVPNYKPQITSETRSQVKGSLSLFGKKVILLHPYGGWKLKSMPEKLVRDICDFLYKNNFLVIQIGGPNDKPLKGVHGSLLKDWSPAAWRIIFEASVALVGVDSWPSHFANILDIPQVTYYGSTHPAQVNSKAFFLNQKSPSLKIGPIVSCSPCESLVCHVYHEPECRGFDFKPEALDQFLVNLSK